MVDFPGFSGPDSSLVSLGVIRAPRRLNAVVNTTPSSSSRSLFSRMISRISRIASRSVESICSFFLDASSSQKSRQAGGRRRNTFSSRTDELKIRNNAIVAAYNSDWDLSGVDIDVIEIVTDLGVDTHSISEKGDDVGGFSWAFDQEIRTECRFEKPTSEIKV